MLLQQYNTDCIIDFNSLFLNVSLNLNCIQLR